MHVRTLLSGCGYNLDLYKIVFSGQKLGRGWPWLASTVARQLTVLTLIIRTFEIIVLFGVN